MKKLVRGMVKDNARVDQPEGTMRDALNANLHISKGTVANEYGTTLYPGNNNFRVLGRVTLEDDRIVMFGFNVSLGVEEIRILDTRNTDTIILYQDSNLNFKDSHPIVCVARKNQSNEHIVYFTDGYVRTEEVYQGYDNITESNPPRVINVTKQLEWRYGGGLATQLYNTVNNYKKLELVPHIGTHSTIDSVIIEAGGALPSGAYYLAIAYADKSGLETNYFTMANPVYVVPGDENAVPTNTLIGAEGGTSTGKLIKWKLTIPDDVNYDLIQPAIVRLINEEQVGFKLPAVQLNRGGAMYITYTGTEGALPISPEDIIVDDVHYASASAIAQLDNRLYLGNVTSSKDIGFQPFANNIRIASRTETISNFNPRAFDTFILNQGYASMLQTFDRPIGRQYFQKYTYDATNGYEVDQAHTPIASYAEMLNNIMVGADGETLRGYRSPKYNFKKKSFRRGEVYSFYISFVLKDGTETYAYHIPGRQSKEISGDSSETTTITTYEKAQWYKLTFIAEDYADPFADPIELEIVFIRMVGVTGYTDGFYRDTICQYVTSQDQEWVAAFQSGGSGLPDLVDPNTSSSTGSDPCGLIATSTSDGGVFGSTNHGGAGVANKLYSWLVTWGPPILTGTYEWKDAMFGTAGGFEGPDVASTIQTETTTSGYSGVTQEKDRLDALPYEEMRAAIGFRPEEYLQQNKNARIYQVIDTSELVDNSDNLFMGFWENENETYPTTSDFLQGDVSAEGDAIIRPSLLSGQPVRHHKFPSNLTTRSFINRAVGTNSSYVEQASKLPTGSSMTTPDGGGDNGGIALTEEIRLLGFELRNLKLPKYILEQVQGYKVYYAKRSKETELFLGKVLLFQVIHDTHLLKSKTCLMQSRGHTRRHSTCTAVLITQATAALRL